ncbi:MAG: hypothetical protein LUF92_05580, partial [Clostridiales bacterium]|nr:hypothetical protein [Clostridiales bacterium]
VADVGNTAEDREETVTDGEDTAEDRKDASSALEWTVYGRIPVMRSAQCVKKTAGLCDGRPEVLWLEDQKGRRLPVATHCDACYNTIWLDQPMNRIGEEMGLLRGRVHTFRFHFFKTELCEIDAVVREFQQWERNHFSPMKRKIPDQHWKRGVE